MFSFVFKKSIALMSAGAVLDAVGVEDEARSNDSLVAKREGQSILPARNARQEK
ncbi:MAG: hypothetical protein ACTHJ4_01855 [Candidatus Nucleicultricaceae bacterium]|jgi:hypothetical protein